MRVLVATTHNLIADIVTDALSGQPDIEVTSVRWEAARIAREAERRVADIVITNHRASEAPAVFAELLARRPTLRVLSIVCEGRTSFLYALCPREVPLGELSASGLLHAVRAVAAAQEQHGAPMS